MLTRAHGVGFLRVALTRGESPFESALSVIPAELDWQRDALCAQVDMDAFFPEKGGSTAAAKAVCAVCPVAGPCLRYALDHDERFGIWGGYSERERRRLKKGLVAA